MRKHLLGALGDVVLADLMLRHRRGDAHDLDVERPGGLACLCRPGRGLEHVGPELILMLSEIGERADQSLD
jgi:hypothetical protein